MATLYIPTIMRNNVNGQAKVEVAGTTVSAVIDALVTDYPRVRSQLLDDAGQMRPHVNLFVNGQDIRALDGVATAVADQDEVYVLSAMAGG